MPDNKKPLTQKQALRLLDYITKNNNLTVDDYIKMAHNYPEGSFLEQELKKIKQYNEAEPKKYKNWGDRGGNYFIHDKQLDHVFRFTHDGKLISATPAGRGTAKGDHKNTSDPDNVSTWQKFATTPKTRAQFDLDDGPSAEYPLGGIGYNLKNILPSDKVYTAIHPVYLNNPTRLNRILNPNSEKCMSGGCSNVPEMWYSRNAPIVNLDSMIVTPEPKSSNLTDWSFYDKFVPGFSKRDENFYNFVNNLDYNYESPKKVKRLPRQYEYERIKSKDDNFQQVNLKRPTQLELPKGVNILNKADVLYNENSINEIEGFKNIVRNNDIVKNINTPDLIGKIDLKQPSFMDITQNDNILNPINNNIENKNVDLKLENIPKNNNMPTIADIIKDMQTPDEENKRGVVSANKPDDNLDWIRELILKESMNSNKLLDSILSEPIQQQSMMLNNGLDIPNNIYPLRPTKNFSTMDIFGNIDEPINHIKTKPISSIPLDNNFNIPSFSTGNSIIDNSGGTNVLANKKDLLKGTATPTDLATMGIFDSLKNKSEAQDEQTLMDQIVSANNSDRKKMNALNTMKAVDSASSLLNNLLEGDGITPIESTHLISPEMKYDDTIRRAIASEASKSGQIAQSNAMKLGMGAMIPAIQNNVLRSTNEANTQAQAQLNQIEQQNASTAAQTANNEQQIFIQQRDKIIQDALLKNASRQQAIGQSKDALWKDITRGIEQNQLYKDADMQAKVYEYMKKYPGADADQLMAFINPNAYTKKKGTSGNSSDEDLINEFLKYKESKK